MKKAANISYPHGGMRRNRFKSLGSLVPILALLLSASFAEVSFAQDGTSANPVVFRGTNAKDEFEQGRLTGFRRFLGRGNPNDQVNYDGARSNYGFIPNGTNRYIVTKPNGDFDDLRSVEGVYFRRQREFFFIRDIENSAANPVVFQGTRGRDEFEEGRLTGFRRFIGRGNANDQVNYDGNLSDYTFEANGANRYTVTKPNGDFDDLRTVEGVYFRDEGAFYFIRDIGEADVDGTAANPIVFLGTRAKDEFEEGRLTGFRRFVGRGNANDQVNYDGNLSDYTFTANGTNRFTVTKPNGNFDDLRTVEGVYFRDQQQFFFIRDILNTDSGDDLDRIEHNGRDVRLVGANLAYSSNQRFSSDFGRSNGSGGPDASNGSDFRGHFEDISAAGGNSARIWLHTTGQVTPNIETNGNVVGLSRELSNAQVITQIRRVLDDAESRGILVTLSLFSFDMLCNNYGDDFAYDQNGGNGTLIRHRTMLTNTTRLNSYLQNGLRPMVEALSNHPAMFAWEIFNEPEGMYGSHPTGSAFDFCDRGNNSGLSDLAGGGIDRNIAARFVNYASALIHSIDADAKVTSSISTEYYDDFTNETLRNRPDFREGGLLDFYQLHWYRGQVNDPYNTPASFYNSDVPIVMGEFDLDNDSLEIGVERVDAIRRILENGYAGAWPWSLTTTSNTRNLTDSIQNAADLVNP